VGTLVGNGGTHRDAQNPRGVEEGSCLSRAPSSTGDQHGGPAHRDQDTKEWINALDRLIRWNVFLTHSVLSSHAVIDTITGDKLSHDSAHFLQLCDKAHENTRSYKRNTIYCFDDGLSTNYLIKLIIRRRIILTLPLRTRST
jgi:hypothetical protein